MKSLLLNGILFLSAIAIADGPTSADNRSIDKEFELAQTRAINHFQSQIYQAGALLAEANRDLSNYPASKKLKRTKIVLEATLSVIQVLTSQPEKTANFYTMTMPADSLSSYLVGETVNQSKAASTLRNISRRFAQLTQLADSKALEYFHERKLTRNN